MDTAIAAKANPDTKFAIVDYAYPDCWPGAVEGKDCGSDVELPNVRGLAFQTDEAAFLAGMLAAGMTKTGSWYIWWHSAPDRDHLHEGLRGGRQVLQPEEWHEGRSLGWEPATKEGFFTGNFNSPDDAASSLNPWSRKALTSSCRSPARLVWALLLTARKPVACNHRRGYRLVMFLNTRRSI